MSIRLLPARNAVKTPCATGRRLKYGELAADAARLPVPEKVVLKRPADSS